MENINTVSGEDLSSKTSDLTIISYNENNYKEANSFTEDILQKHQEQIFWVDVNNLRDLKAIEQIGDKVGLHHLIVEDILNTNHMVKMDSYDDCLFLIFKMLKYDATASTIITEHISLVLKGNYLLSFQELDGDIFSQVKEKIKNGKDKIRKLGSDYLFYELIDTVVDNYFSVLDNLGDLTDDIEEELMSTPSKKTLQRIYLVKRELMYLRKALFPMRELIGKLSRCEFGFISEPVVIYLRDVYDHLIQIVDTTETYQDIMSNMLDTYLSSIGNKTNDIMKVLTIFSAIFIPLTFLAGIYGMNFKEIPELSFKYGYLMFWIVSVMIVISLLWFFHKKKWF